MERYHKSPKYNWYLIITELKKINKKGHIEKNI